MFKKNQYFSYKYIYIVNFKYKKNIYKAVNLLYFNFIFK
jgi:hypothetical protein